MFIRVANSITHYYRKSKKGKIHPSKRMKQVAVFVCDECENEFKREKGKVDPKRLSDNYFHGCENCDPKRVAQKKGVQKRLVWNMPAGSTLDISKI